MLDTAFQGIERFSRGLHLFNRRNCSLSLLHLIRILETFPKISRFLSYSKRFPRYNQKTKLQLIRCTETTASSQAPSRARVELRRGRRRREKPVPARGEGPAEPAASRVVSVQRMNCNLVFWRYLGNRMELKGKWDIFGNVSRMRSIKSRSRI